MTSIFRRHSRGRPPHPDVLTPAEWRVLEEIREGRSNPEIADRLGISRNTVKTHISSMLSKLDLRDREQLAAWRGEPVVASARRSFLLAPFGWLTSKVAGGIAVAAVSVLLVGAFIVAMESGRVTDNGSESPPFANSATEPPPEPTEPATQQPSPTDAVPTFDQLSVGDPAAFPEGIALYVWEGCTSCDGPPQALRRFERIGGDLEVTVLFERSGSSPYILSGWIDGEFLYLLECTTGYCGGIVDVSDDASVTLYRSQDDGATWDSLGTQPISSGQPTAQLDPAAWGVATVATSANDAVNGVVEFSGLRLDLAALDPRGAASATSPAYRVLPPVSVARNGEMAVRWYALTSPSSPSHYLTRFAADGTPMNTYANVVDGPWFWLDDDRLVGTIWYQGTRPLQVPDMQEAWLPTVLDLQTGTAHPIVEPFENEPLNRNSVMGVRVR